MRPFRTVSNWGLALSRLFESKMKKRFPESPPIEGHVRAILLDSYQKGLDGGTGETFDWRLACQAKTCGIPMVLSGGLNPGNIQEALNKVHPSAIDISSGVEERPGIKDHERIRLFMERVRDFAGQTI